MNIDNNGKVGYLSRDTSNLYNVKPLTKDENQELFIQWHDNNDESARDKIILGNIKFAISISVKYISIDPAYDSDDLLQIAIIGLIKAVDSFDYTRGYSFTTYSGRIIANELNMLWRRFKYLPLILSLDAPINALDTNGIILRDILIDRDTNIEMDVEYSIMSTLIESELDCLSERDKNIIIDQFGLNNTIPLTQQKCAEKYGVSQASICRIVLKSLKNNTHKIIIDNIISYKIQRYNIISLYFNLLMGGEYIWEICQIQFMQFQKLERLLQWKLSVQPHMKSAISQTMKLVSH